MSVSPLAARNNLSRFMARVQVAPDGCWIWTGSRTKKGYGLSAMGGLQTTAHRVSYRHFVGPIPEGLQLDHLCRQPSCVNPEHLEPVTARENLMRGNSSSARYAARTHCSKGHEFTAENTYVTRDGARVCRTCRTAYSVIYQPAYRARQKAARAA